MEEIINLEVLQKITEGAASTVNAAVTSDDTHGAAAAAPKQSIRHGDAGQPADSGRASKRQRKEPAGDQIPKK